MYRKDAHCFGTDFWSLVFFCATFSFLRYGRFCIRSILMKSESNTWKSPIYKIDRSSKTKKCTQKRFFLVKDLQTPLPSKRAVLILWSVIMHYVSRRMKKTQKNIFRFLVFEIWSSWPSRYTLKSEKYLKTNILFFRPISMRISTFQTILRKNEFLLRIFFFF